MHIGLNGAGLRNYLAIYTRLLRSQPPVAIQQVTTYLFADHLSFLRMSVVLYLSLAVLRIGISGRQRFWREWIIAQLLIASLSLGVGLFYALCTPSPSKRTQLDFMKLTTILIGIQLPIIGLGLVVDTFFRPFALLAMFIVAIPMTKYLILVFRDFWEHPVGVVVLFGVLALLSGVMGATFWLLFLLKFLARLTFI